MPTYTRTATAAVNLARGGSAGAWAAGSVSISSTFNTGQYTDYVRYSGFGFTIPGTETIVGVSWGLSLLGQPDTNATAQDDSVLLYSGSAFLGTNHGLAAALNNISYTLETWGGVSDVWGATLTPAIVNAAGFGGVYSAKFKAGPSFIDIATNAYPTMTITTMASNSYLPNGLLALPPFGFRVF